MTDYREQKIIDKLVTARIALLLKHPFFGNLATRLKLKNADDWCPTAATDGLHLFYNREFITPLSSDELDELSKLIKENNLKIASGHLLNYHPAIQVIKNLIKDDSIGDIINIKSFRHNFGRFRVDEDVVSSFMPHDLSLIFNFFKNEKIIDKQLFKWRILSPVQDDEARLFLKFDNNKTAIVSNLWTNHKKRHELIITGNKGMIIFDDNEKNINKKIKLIQFEFYSENNHSLPKISTEDYININSVAKPLNVEIDQSLKYFDGEIDFIVNSFEESYKILSFIFNLSKQNANLRLVK